MWGCNILCSIIFSFDAMEKNPWNNTENIVQRQKANILKIPLFTALKTRVYTLKWRHIWKAPRSEADVFSISSLLALSLAPLPRKWPNQKPAEFFAIRLYPCWIFYVKFYRIWQSFIITESTTLSRDIEIVFLNAFLTLR